MSTEEVLKWLVPNLIPAVVIFSALIQITPVKWNPITSFIKWLGKIITAPVEDTLDKLTTTVDDLQTEVNTNEKDRIRWEVLDFANSCRNGQKHTKEEFRHIISLNDKYKCLLEKTNDKNGVFEADFAYIHKIYDKCQEKNSFLSEGDE